MSVSSVIYLHRATTQTIGVSTPGVYSVLVTDAMSNTCSDDITISMSPPDDSIINMD